VSSAEFAMDGCDSLLDWVRLSGALDDPWEAQTNSEGHLAGGIGIGLGPCHLL